jgi:hypothetical protein
VNPDYAATAPNKLSRMPVIQFSMDFPLFKAGNRTGTAQNAFDTDLSPAGTPFHVFFDNTSPARTFHTNYQ